MTGRREERTSFLKKISKKLFYTGRPALSTGTLLVERAEPPYGKSFLLLFFKKTVLSYF